MIIIEIIFLALVAFITHFIQCYCIDEKNLTIKGLKKYNLVLLINAIIATTTFLTTIILLIITAAIYE